MREHIVNAVILAVKETFRTMMSWPVENRPPIVRSDPMTFDGVSAIIGLVGKVTGSLSIHCPEEAALKVTSRLLGLDVKGITPEVKDAVGELINVVAGVAKRKASERDSVFEISIPTIITGKGHSVMPWVKWPNTIVEFSLGGDTFSVIVCVK